MDIKSNKRKSLVEKAIAMEEQERNRIEDTLQCVELVICVFEGLLQDLATSHARIQARILDLKEERDVLDML